MTTDKKYPDKIIDKDTGTIFLWKEDDTYIEKGDDRKEPRLWTFEMFNNRRYLFFNTRVK